MEINYIGEHLLPGILGRLVISFSFLFVLASGVFYTLYSFRKDKSAFLKIGRISYLAHSGLLVLAMLVLYYLIFNHAFEYSYVTQYSSKELPFTYLISSLWAGQEGSFLIWAFFQAFLGLILLFRAKDWEPETIAVVSLSQAFLILMILGWNIGGIHIGTDPFVLLRETPSAAKDPLFQRPDYLNLIIDGQGLNPLLENIWMAIHPPLLFLGYAALLIPFAYAIAGLWKNNHTDWRSPALPWLNFAGLSLGVGIILGGAWAYVSLTFGGFWAWDPVENASLVPWLFIIATLHVLLIARKRAQNMVWVYLFAILSYFFVLYASYLTRSGVLKDSSAHAFGDEGKAVALVIYNLVFLIGGILLLIFKHPKTEDKSKENLTSREFWVFIGSLVLVLSAFQIIVTTSIPVINKIFGTALAPPTDSISFYNAWQLPYAILIALLVGLTHFQKYGSSPYPDFLKKAVPSLVISFAITVLFIFIYPFKNSLHYLFLFFLVFMLSSTINSLIKRKKKQKNLGALITHLGLALFMMGILITFSSVKIISSAGDGVVTDERTQNKVMVKGDTVSMDTYQVIYHQREEKGKWLYFTLSFYNEDKNGNLKHQFDIKPAINRNSRMGNVYEPATRHLFSRDIYGYITFAQNIGLDDISGYSLKLQPEISLKDSVEVDQTIFYLDSIASDMSEAQLQIAKLEAFLTAKDTNGIKKIHLNYLVNGARLDRNTDTLQAQNWILRFNGIAPEMNRIQLGIYEPGKDYIVMKVMVFPFIGLMWAGAVILFVGLLVSLIKRLKARKSDQK
ncbi:MAG: cytochrome c biogenesis protein CcsA [Bacteroidales bacterium]